MAGIRIKWLSDIADAVRGNKTVKDSLDDVADALQDVSKGTGDLGRARGADQLEDSLSDIERQAKRTEAAVQDIGDSGNRGLSKLGGKSAEVGQEIRQNLGEGIANAARGDFESLSDTIGDTFGGAVAGIGGIGAAGVAAGGALGVGALVASLVLAEEERKKLEERAADLANAYIEAGSNVLNSMSVVSRTNEILISTDDETKNNLKDLTGALGDRALAARALAGDNNALAAANSLVTSTDEEYLDLTVRQSQGYTELSSAEQDRLEKLQLLRREVGELNGVTEKANANFADSQRALVGLINDADGAVKEVDELGNQLYRLPDGTEILIDAKTGQATTDVSNFKGDLDGIPENVTSTVTVNLQDNATAQMNGIISRLQGRSVTVGVGTVLKPGFLP